MDAFALLGLPRQPWLDPATVRTAFQSRARTLHPDAAEGDAAAFARLNTAYRDVRRPASRLRLLLGEVEIPSVPPDPELGFRIGTFAREADALLAKWRAASTPLARALLVGEMQRGRKGLAELQAVVGERLAVAEGRLRAADAADLALLASLAAELTFLERWDAQLRERALEFAVSAANA